MPQLPDTLPDYAARVLDAFGGVLNAKEQPDGWQMRCPVPKHGSDGEDSHPSLRISVGDGGRMLVCCRAGCETAEVLSAANLTYRDLFPGPGEEPLPTLALEPEPLTEELADLRHAVYGLLLEQLDLSEAHRADLQRRGLSDADIKSGSYKSLSSATRSKALKALCRHHEQDLYRVPGFRPNNLGDPEYASLVEGLLVPVRDEKQRIVALKARRGDDQPGPRYVYFSGGQDGLTCGSPLHHPVTRPHPDDGTIYVTEGELKADVFSAIDVHECLGTPGVGQWRKASREIAEHPEWQVINIAFDWRDVKSNGAVFDATRSFVEDLKGLGKDVGLVTWDGYEEKGIDDLLAAGGVPSVIRGEELEGLLGNLARGFHARGCQVTEELLPFPSHVFPAAIRDFVEAVAQSKQCPVDFPGLACLVIAGAMVGSTRRLKISGTWSEQPGMYAAIIAPPGSRKSPALKVLMAPLYELQQKASREWEDDEGAVPLRHYFVNDITVEGLSKVLHTNQRGIVVFNDEISGWVASQNQYRGGKGADRQFYLSAWSGEPIKVDRKSSGSLYVPHPFLSVLGGIQPDMLGSLEDKQRRNDGFLDRLLMSIPEFPPPSGWQEHTLDDQIALGWHQTIMRLNTLEFHQRAAKLKRSTGEVYDVLLPEPVNVTFSPGGWSAWESWYNAHERLEMANKDFPRKLVGFWMKLEAYSARFALILSLLRADNPEGRRPVDEQDVAGAVCLVDYFKSHFRLISTKLKSMPEDDYLDRLLELAAQRAGTVSCRDAMRGLRLNTRSEALSLFKRAADLGHGRLDKGKHPITGRSYDMFVLTGPSDE